MALSAIQSALVRFVELFSLVGRRWFTGATGDSSSGSQTGINGTGDARCCLIPPTGVPLIPKPPLWVDFGEHHPEGKAHLSDRDCRCIPENHSFDFIVAMRQAVTGARNFPPRDLGIAFAQILREPLYRLSNNKEQSLQCHASAAGSSSASRCAVGPFVDRELSL